MGQHTTYSLPLDILSLVVYIYYIGANTRKYLKLSEVWGRVFLVNTVPLHEQCRRERTHASTCATRLFAKRAPFLRKQDLGD